LQVCHQISAKSVNIASLVRSLKSNVHYTDTGVINCQVYVRAYGKTSAHLKFVFKMCVLERKLE